jgi:anthranilate phosphoribosyltransferase
MPYDNCTQPSHHSETITEDWWHGFWDRLQTGALQRDETVDLLTRLCTERVEEETLSAFVLSLRARRGAEKKSPMEAVNIVGTGGGISTFNVSTAAAFVAASLGVRVVKTGSRAYTSRCGSVDLLQFLGIPLTRSQDDVAASLDRFGIAFAGYHVYPRELVLLAKAILPTPMRAFGRLLNVAGPFIADGPVAQLTGVSDPDLLPMLGRLAARDSARQIWLCANELGADELISFAQNIVRRTGESDDLTLTREICGFAHGALSDLAPAETQGGIVTHFRSVLSGDGSPSAIETVCLNAAALAMLGGVATTWPDAIARARSAMTNGDALRLVDAIRHAANGTRTGSLS